jgi:phage terminase large subunit-like protein
MKQLDPLSFFSRLKWLDNRPLLSVIEPYRRRDLASALYTFEEGGTVTVSPRLRYNMALIGRAKKNYKTCDLILAALYRLLAWKSPGGNQVYILANDEDQAADDLELARKLVSSNPLLSSAVYIKQKMIERRDYRGFLEILPAGDVVGTHGKTYLFCGFDEIHGYKDWGLLESLQLDPTRSDALMYITSYASIYHRPGIPLFDLFAAGKRGDDPRMYFSWYAADYVTDSAFENLSPEQRANPSMKSWEDKNYLAQQQARLPSHKYRRLHLNLPEAPEGSAFSAERIMESVDRGVKLRDCDKNQIYFGFVDMSGGSNDDAVLAIAHRDNHNAIVLDRVMDQGQRPPFDPTKAVERFVPVLQEYNIRSVTGDNYAGQTFQQHFQQSGISYRVSELSKSEIYEELEPLLNGNRVVLLDVPVMESQFLSLVWRASRIDHGSGEHDDWSNAAAGAIRLAAEHKVFNPYAVPIAVGKVGRPFGNSLGPRNAPTELPQTKIPIPVGVGNSGISLGSSNDYGDGRYQGYIGARIKR